MPTHLLDSDVCIDLLGERVGPLVDQVDSVLDNAAISVITAGEVLDGVLMSRYPHRDMVEWQTLAESLDFLDVTREIADIWAILRGDLRARGQRIPDNDLLIASTALRFDLTLISRNERHFSRVPGLALMVPG